jgi:hypothetical protein
MSVQDDVRHVRRWWTGARHDPFIWTIILAPLIFACVTVGPALLVPVIVPPAAVVSTVIQASGKRLSAGIVSGPRILCRANGFHLLGYKAIFGGDHLELKEAEVCWDMRGHRWVWEFRDKSISELNSP